MKAFTLLLFTILINSAYAKVRPFETTHLKATSGAGVGSLLIDESSILNPASIAFYNTSSFYFSRTGSEVTRSSNTNYENRKDGNTAFILSDSKGKTAGSLSYIQQTFLESKRKTMAASMAYPVGNYTSLGTTYKIIKEENNLNSENFNAIKYNEFIIGVSHVVSPNVTMGLVVNNPLDNKYAQRLAKIGFQYTFNGFISLIGDAGSDYKQTLSDNLIYNIASQFKIFESVFLRVGTFRDKLNLERGDGLGLSWVQPKLVLEFALKNTKVEKSPERDQEGSSIKESSFSLAYKF